VQEYSFAAHVDGKENMEFVQEVGAPVVVSTRSFLTSP
jgi:cleavage and polyadenylation specificity factor subunit 3